MIFQRFAVSLQPVGVHAEELRLIPDIGNAPVPQFDQMACHQIPAVKIIQADVVVLPRLRQNNSPRTPPDAAIFSSAHGIDPPAGP